MPIILSFLHKENKGIVLSLILTKKHILFLILDEYKIGKRLFAKVITISPNILHIHGQVITRQGCKILGQGFPVVLPFLWSNCWVCFSFFPLPLGAD